MREELRREAERRSRLEQSQGMSELERNEQRDRLARAESDAARMHGELRESRSISRVKSQILSALIDYLDD